MLDADFHSLDPAHRQHYGPVCCFSFQPSLPVSAPDVYQGLFSQSIIARVQKCTLGAEMSCWEGHPGHEACSKLHDAAQCPSTLEISKHNFLNLPQACAVCLELIGYPESL
jgi:hypothetical protein